MLRGSPGTCRLSLDALFPKHGWAQKEIQFLQPTFLAGPENKHRPSRLIVFAVNQSLWGSEETLVTNREVTEAPGFQGTHSTDSELWLDSVPGCKKETLVLCCHSSEVLWCSFYSMRISLPTVDQHGVRWTL